MGILQLPAKTFYPIVGHTFLYFLKYLIFSTNSFVILKFLWSFALCPHTLMGILHLPMKTLCPIAGHIIRKVLLKVFYNWFNQLLFCHKDCLEFSTFSKYFCENFTPPRLYPSNIKDYLIDKIILFRKFIDSTIIALLICWILIEMIVGSIITTIMWSVTWMLWTFCRNIVAGSLTELFDQYLKCESNSFVLCLTFHLFIYLYFHFIWYLFRLALFSFFAIFYA